jgi:hypothetical protein
MMDLRAMLTAHTNRREKPRRTTAGRAALPAPPVAHPTTRLSPMPPCSYLLRSGEGDCIAPPVSDAPASPAL